jgi:hypothetical protein
MKNDLMPNSETSIPTSVVENRPGWLRHLRQWLKYFLPVLLLAIYPAIFHYSNNAANLLPGDLGLQVLLYTAIALLVYGLASALFHRSLLKAANTALGFLIFFNLYGVLYGFLLKLDIVRVEHYTLLSFFLLLALYAAWFISKLPEKPASILWKAAVLIFGVLSLFNLIRIVPAEIAKARLDSSLKLQETAQQVAGDTAQPDIYYIILDEFVGLKAMREYWDNPAVDPFETFLKSNGFLVAENSHGSTTNTLHQMATRFNYQEYSLDVPDYQQIWFNDIADNRAMRYLKSMGYTTVVFDEKSMAYPSEPPIIADVSFNYGEIPHTQPEGFFNDYGLLIAENTMLRAFSRYLRPAAYVQHIDMIKYTIEKIGNLDEIASPKFVHVHLMLPHAPFMFDEDGKLTDSRFYHNWGHYLDNYNYALQVAEKLVSNILASSDPANPPVIILQSDHGARNKADCYEGVLENYPDEYKTSILFAIHLPGLTESQFPQDIDPINTFPLVFNQLFDANIPLK